MIDHIELGPVPPDEDCAQIGEPNYGENARKECRRYIALLREVMGPPPDGSALVIRANHHDFGRYFEVICQFDDSVQEAVEYAFRLESDGPRKWNHQIG